ncbi:RICIN domain-containing protein [Mycobacterium angelicum]|nr:RICIN domain-containing protein [Mycobacterium angelicum]MCV7196704.1 ricin-type beta-trefoil lectin domain protein [Mycobacterium angelicum]
MTRARSLGGVRQAVVVVSTSFGITAFSAAAAHADEPVQLKSGLGDFCLDGPSGDWYTPVVINPCNGADSQRWNSTGDEQESVAFPGECLTRPYEHRDVFLQPCSNWPSQHFSYQPNGQISSGFGGCLAVNGPPAPGASLYIGFCIPDAPYQHWDSVP